MSTSWTTLSGAGGTVVFGTGTFVLHALRPGTPALADGEVSGRTAEIVGYILPAGANAAERGAAMDRARRLLCRTVGDADGFTLRHGGKSVRLICRRAPEFAADAPLNGTDAARFTVLAESVGDGALLGAEESFLGRGLLPALAFPLAVTEETVFAVLAHAGTLVVENPGELPCGFAAEITAEGGEITSVSLSLGGDALTVTHPLAEGESLLIDTRAGQKGVTCGGVSVMENVDWRSVFFSLTPGENRIAWESEGFGHAVMRLRFTPRYL